MRIRSHKFTKQGFLALACEGRQYPVNLRLDDGVVKLYPGWIELDANAMAEFPILVAFRDWLQQGYGGVITDVTGRKVSVSRRRAVVDQILGTD